MKENEKDIFVNGIIDIDLIPKKEYDVLIKNLRSRIFQYLMEDKSKKEPP